jgi:hypothetical protein
LNKTAPEQSLFHKDKNKKRFTNRDRQSLPFPEEVPCLKTEQLNPYHGGN